MRRHTLVFWELILHKSMSHRVTDVWQQQMRSNAVDHGMVLVFGFLASSLLFTLLGRLWPRFSQHPLAATLSWPLPLFSHKHLLYVAAVISIVSISLISSIAMGSVSCNRTHLQQNAENVI